MQSETSLPTLMEQLIALIRERCVRDEYQVSVTDEQCIGLALAHSFQQDTRIFTVLYEALEHAGFYTEAEAFKNRADGAKAKHAP